MKMTTLAMIVLTSFSWVGLLTPLKGWSQPCSEHADCPDDGLRCNGVVECSSLGNCRVRNRVYCRSYERCDEESLECVNVCGVRYDQLDKDDDGFNAIECGGNDCDDNDRYRYPGNAEVCDQYGHDEDCDPATFGYRDSDGDGYVDALCRN